MIMHMKFLIPKGEGNKMIAENTMYRARRELQRLIEIAFEKVRDGDCKSKEYSALVDNYEYLQKRHQNLFGERYYAEEQKDAEGRRQ